MEEDLKFFAEQGATIEYLPSEAFHDKLVECAALAAEGTNQPPASEREQMIADILNDPPPRFFYGVRNGGKHDLTFYVLKDDGA